MCLPVVAVLLLFSKDTIHGLENALGPELSASERREISLSLMKFSNILQKT